MNYVNDQSHPTLEIKDTPPFLVEMKDCAYEVFPVPSEVVTVANDFSLHILL